VLGTPDIGTALVLVALFVALLLGLVSYHNQGRNYVTFGVGLLTVATALVLLIQALGRPSAGSALALLLLAVAVMSLLLTYQDARWAHLTFVIGVIFFMLGLPFLGAGRGDLALLALIGGSGLLMLVAALHPEVPARYSRLGAPANEPVTDADLAVERSRYTRLAAGITVASLAGVWLLGGVPQGPVSEASVPVVVDEALAQKGQQLYTQYGCVACHSVNGQAGVGPSFKGVYGHTVRLTDGTQVLADDAYTRESIAQPNAKIVNGFSSGVMLGAIGGNLPEITQQANLDALVEFIKSVR
jgi:mono/diheme cytochrome c family protein